ncbi:MAG: hypothetical protein ABIL76_06830 [candidate division WOR-3 bacterium]
MLVITLSQSMLMGPPIVIKEGPKNIWVYNKKYQTSPIEWTYSANPNEKVFGIPQFFKGDCPYANEKVLTNESCDFYYASDIVDFNESTLKLYVKGKGKFRISVNSSKGYINQEVELNDNWQEISFDLTKAVHITQHGDKLKTNLKISFTPLTNSFEIYVSKFILK